MNSNNLRRSVQSRKRLRHILAMRDRGIMYRDIAKKYNISPGRALQLYRKALNRTSQGEL